MWGPGKRPRSYTTILPGTILAQVSPKTRRSSSGDLYLWLFFLRVPFYQGVYGVVIFLVAVVIFAPQSSLTIAFLF